MKTLLAWSSGKDSAWSLHLLRQRADVEVVGLLTTTQAADGHVTMHDVRPELLRAQANAVGLPLKEVRIPRPCPSDQYEALMAEAMREARDGGIEAIAFGDLFLEDLRRYREEKMASVGMGALFPVWGMPTRDLAEEMLAAGVVAHFACVDSRRVDRSFAGQRWDTSLIAALPPGTDPCGENGEFHTFVSAGPMFASSLPVSVGDVIERDGLAYADLRLAV